MKNVHDIAYCEARDTHMRMYRTDEEATAFIGATPCERSTSRGALRNGTHSRTLSTHVLRMEERCCR